MNTEEIMKLADAYAGRFGAYRLSQTGLTLSEYQQARAALEAALTAKQGEQALQDVSDPAPSVSAQESEIVLSRESFLMTGQRIAELEDELHEQARVNGMGSEREATLMAKVEQLLEALTGYHSNSTKEDWPVGVWLAAEDTIAKIKGVLG